MNVNPNYPNSSSSAMLETMEGEVEIMEPLEIHYSDLLLLSSSSDTSSSSLSTEELQKIELLSGAVMRALGPSGPGLLSITGVSKALELRRVLLPLARKLALLGNKERAQVLKENGLGSDVPLKNLDRSVSSFAMQLKYNQFSYLESIPSPFNNGNEDGHEEQLIRHIFKELGRCMIELGLRLAHVCDKMIGGSELRQSILDAGTAKGRLIHYHSALDRLLLKEENKITKNSTSKSTSTTSTVSNLLTSLQDFSSSDGKEVSSSSKYFSNLWQQWHYDYGIFTVLTYPLFMLMNDSFCVEDCSTPDEHTYLQLFDSNTGRVLLVKTSPESFLIQVGESADILSNGKLRSTLHSVRRPLEIETLSRETFVVFLQPPWNKTLPFPSYFVDAEAKSDEVFTSNDAALDAHMIGSGDPHHIFQEISKNISPLSSRFKRGMTFAEFSRETTKKYYGGSGTQSKRH